jgi:hypothetical protein
VTPGARTATSRTAHNLDADTKAAAVGADDRMMALERGLYTGVNLGSIRR